MPTESIASLCYPGRPGTAPRDKPTAAMHECWLESSEQRNRERAAMQMFPLSVRLAELRGEPLSRGELVAIHTYPGMGGVPNREEMWPS